MDELKKGLWGYRKDSVYHYIVSLEEEASKRVAERDARMDKLETDARQQIAELEAALAALRAENQALRDNQELVFSTMLEAQRYAEQLKADSYHQAKQAQEKLSSAIEQENQQLSGYKKRVEQLRTVIQELLEEFDGKAEEVEKALERLPAQAPGAAPGWKEPDVKILFGGAPAAGAEAAMPERERGEAWNKLSYI